MEKKDNSGVLFKNDKKESEKHPDYKGNITVGGMAYRTMYYQTPIQGWCSCHSQQHYQCGC